MIRVLIRASTSAGRAGLESLLRPYSSLQLIDEDEDTLDVSDDLSRPDVIVVQIEGEETEVIQQLLENGAGGIPVVLLGGPLIETNGILRQGVRGALPASASGEQLVAAIQAVCSGLVVFEPTELDGLLEPALAPPVREPLLEPLTDREIEVLRLLADGFANKEIASRMGISEHTVKFHVASIMGKLGAGNRTEAVMSGIRHGLLMV